MLLAINWVAQQIICKRLFRGHAQPLYENKISKPFCRVAVTDICKKLLSEDAENAIGLEPRENTELLFLGRGWCI